VLFRVAADRAPEAGLIPPGGTMERFRVQEWLNFLATKLHKGFGPLWHRETDQSTRDAAVAGLHSRFTFVEERLGRSDYLASDSFSVVDAYAFTIITWSNILEVDLGPYPRIRIYLDRIAARAAVRQAMAAEGLIRKAA
jgi:glutathione S-transferase